MKKLAPFIVAAATLVGAGCGSLQPWAARVNGQLVSRSALDTELHTILHNKTYLQEVDAQLAQEGARVEGSGKDTVDSAFAARALTRRILLKLVHQEVGRRHLRITPADLTQARSSVESGFSDPKTFKRFPKSYQTEIIRSSAEVGALQKSLESGASSDAALRRLYDEHKADFDETCVSHILVDTKAQADSLRAQIVAGADFAALAKANSKDNQGPTGGSAAKGGDLGCLTSAEADNFDPAFLGAMKALPTGQVSDVVQSQFGFHIIKVTDRRTRPFEEAKQQLQSQQSQQASNDFGDLIRQLVAKAKIEVNPRYGKFDKSAQFGVIPPAAPTVATTTTVPSADQTPGLPDQGPAPSSP